MPGLLTPKVSFFKIDANTGLKLDFSPFASGSPTATTDSNGVVTCDQMVSEVSN
jgi:hypothetical protein